MRLKRTSITLDCDAVGIIGPDILGSCVVVVDYARSTIDLYDPGEYVVPGGAAELPLTFLDRSPFIEVTVELESAGESEQAAESESIRESDKVAGVQALCCLDLGSAGGLHLYSSETCKVEPAGEFTDACLGIGVDGPIHGKLGQVAVLRIGPLELLDVRCAFSDERAYPGYEDTVFGNIGNGVLYKFITTIDYSNRRLFLEPGSRAGIGTGQWEVGD